MGRRVLGLAALLAVLLLAAPLWAKAESGQTLTEGSLKAALEQYLAATEPYKSGQCEVVSVKFGRLPTVPQGRVTYRFVPQGSSNPAYLAGTFYFNVDGREAARVRATAQIELSVPAVVAARPLGRGQILTEDDVSLAQAPYSQAKGALTDVSQAVGATLKTNLAAGDAIHDRQLAKSLMVRRGEAVTIVAQAGGLKVTASGQAKQDGALGDSVAVLNLDSKKTVSGRVIGPSLVEILF